MPDVSSHTWTLQRGVNNMQLPLYRRITDEDLNDAPKGAWKGKLLYALNKFMQQIYSGLNNDLTPEQNCIEQTKTFDLIGNSDPTKNVYSFSTSFTYQPNFIEQWITVADSSSAIFTAAPFATCLFGNGQMNVLGISGLTTGVRYQITLRVWWPGVVN